jgi:hypothetical protein
MIRTAFVALSFLIIGAADAPPRCESYLIAGRLGDGERAMEEAIRANPRDDQARLSLGVTQFLHAVEGRIQAFQRHGFNADISRGLMPITNLPIPKNFAPKPLTYEAARGLLQNWLDDLAKVEATLAQITDADVKLPLHFGLIKLDFNGDGKLDDDETLWKIYARLNPGVSFSAVDAKEFVVTFDRGDVDWLRGYCHLLSALTEAALGYDFSKVFDGYSFLVFAGNKAPFRFQVAPVPENLGFNAIFDAVGLIHDIRLPVAEPARLKSALAHLEATTALSRSSWKSIRAETDDDHEWIPNPKQASVVPGGRVNPEMIEGWYQFLDEFEAILAGKKLAPFWRSQTLGINVRKMFTDPQPLDLVRWVQGPGVAPFLEEGNITSRDVWNRINQLFNGQFVGFAIWFN